MIRKSSNDEKGYQDGSLLNETSEAYTGNPIGRRETSTLPKQFSSERSHLVVVDDVFNDAEVKIVMTDIGEVITRQSGSKSVACWKRSDRNLRDPMFSFSNKGKVGQRKEGRLMEHRESDYFILL
jgi:hypothetical protein